MPPFIKPPEVEAKFWAKVAKLPEEDGHWLWTGTTVGGTKNERLPWFNCGTTHMSANRLAWQLVHQTKLAPRTLLIRCCEEPMCVRPEHYKRYANAGKTSESSSKRIGLRKVELLIKEGVAAEVRSVYSRLAKELQVTIGSYLDVPSIRTELRAEVAKGLDMQLVTASVQSLRQELSAIVKRLDQLSAENASLVAQLDEVKRSIVDLSSITAKNDQVQSIESKLVEALSDPTPERVAPQTRNDPSPVSLVATYIEGELFRLGAELGTEDKQTILEVSSLVVKKRAHPDMAMNLATSWMRTFAGLVSTGVVEPTPAQLLAAIESGWVG